MKYRALAGIYILLAQLPAALAQNLSPGVAQTTATINAINQGQYDPFKVHGLSAFSSSQKTLIRQWITHGVNATRDTLGVYPQTLTFFVYGKKANQPVPWAHTRRGTTESIHLYIDKRFPVDKFINDWTLYHEISHLALPFLGKHYSWLSEGFASFMQYQIMDKANVLPGSLQLRYQDKIAPHLKWFTSDLPSADIARRLMQQNNYPAAYWGGAWFFVLADRQLTTKHDISLASLIAQYQLCCRSSDVSAAQLMASLDDLIHEPLFSQLLYNFEHQAARDIYPQEFIDIE
ncbi:MAG: hypothetical protein ACI9C4_000746 [Paraglaciecola sp.]|jgi:hypothetical protein